jgi:anti-sigma factor RsiW
LKHTTHDDLRQQTAAFALGALDDEARAELEAHLLVCDECADDVRSYNRIATALAYTASAATPDPALRQRIVDAAAQTLSGSAVGISVGKSLSSRPALLLPWLLAAACLVAAVGFGAYATALRRSVAPDCG